MTSDRGPRRGFSLTDLVVASAAVGMMLLLAAPAVNKGRAEVDRRRCEDNLRRLSMGHQTYANVNGGFPPMAMSPDNFHYQVTQPGPGGWYDGHGWYSLVGPYIGEPAWAAQINFKVSMSSVLNAAARRGGLRLKLHACPADIGLQRSEWGSRTWARVLSNYVVNAGNTNYGQTNIGAVPFQGAPFALGAITPIATITDGLSNTLLMSEKVVLRGCTGWSGSYPETQTAQGGQMITGFNPPNPGVPDGIGYGFTGNVDCGSFNVMIARYTEAGVLPLPIALGGSFTKSYLSARSKHPGGVNASMCDGSAGFVASTIDPAVWRALSTAQGAGSGIPQEVNPTVN